MLLASVAFSEQDGLETPPAPTTAQAVEAWLTADRWVRSGEVPAVGTDAASLALPDVEAVSLLLRIDGRVVATGEADAIDDEALRRATGRLLAALAATLQRRWPEPMHDLLREQALLEIELAGSPVPLLGASFDEAAALCEPGLDTLAVRRGSRWTRAFPGRLLASGLAGDPASALSRLATETGLPRGATLEQLVTLDSIGLYRLPTIRLGQTRAGGLPEPLERMETPGFAGVVDRAAIRSLASGVLEHLHRQLHDPAEAVDGAGPSAGLGLRGDFDPISGRHDPFVAPPLAQALVLLAATRLADADETLAPRAIDLATRVIGDLADVDPIEITPDETLEALAAVSIAISRRPALCEVSPAVTELCAAAIEATTAAAAIETAESSTPGVRAIVAASLASHLDDIVDAPSREERRRAAVRLLEEAWAASSPAMRVGLLPWFVWAAPTVSDASAVVGELARYRDRLHELQIESSPDHPEDLVGGFDLEQAARPRADGRSVLPGLGLAMMLADDRLTPRETTPEALASLRIAIRSQRRALEFLRNLVVSPTAAGLLPEGEIALGGVRDAPWDPRQSTMLQAMALWWLAECLDSGLP